MAAVGLLPTSWKGFWGKSIVKVNLVKQHTYLGPCWPTIIYPMKKLFLAAKCSKILTAVDSVMPLLLPRTSPTLSFCLRPGHVKYLHVFACTCLK